MAMKLVGMALVALALTGCTAGAFSLSPGAPREIAVTLSIDRGGATTGSVVASQWGVFATSDATVTATRAADGGTSASARYVIETKEAGSTWMGIVKNVGVFLLGVGGGAAIAP